MSKPVIRQMGAYPPWDEAALTELYDMQRYFEASDKAAFLAEVGPRVRGIVTRGDIGADRAAITACPNLEIVSIFGVGFDAVDLDACREVGARVTNTPDVLTKDVADLAVAMMLCQARGMVGADAWVRNGDWLAKGKYPIKRRVHGARAGILGLGCIGFEIARRLAGFDMDIAYTDVGPKPSAEGLTFIPDPVALAERSDYLFVALAASTETRHIVGREVLTALGPEGMVINVSRAANVDEEALFDALATGALGAAALDVFEGEPDIDPQFLTLDNVRLQPHHASGTLETRKAMGQLMRDNLAAHFDGRALLTPVL